MIDFHPLKDGVISIIWLLAIVALAWVPAQKDFHIIAPLVAVGFASYWYLCIARKTVALKWLIALAVIARVAVVANFPNLSDDVYRFIWDGQCWHAGLHPFAHLPKDVIGYTPSLSQDLFDNLNSQGYFSIYPPVAQLIFWIATSIDGTSLYSSAIIMKSIHCLFDISSIFIIYILLPKFDLDRKWVLLYALNPLIITELIANLHHEGIVIFFILLCLLFLKSERVFFAGVAMAGAIASKILPILFCPLIFFYLKGTKRWIFTATTFITTVILFYPLLQDLTIITNILDSADLYLRKFEFNGGLYYLYRAFGQAIYGYNTIQTLGPILMCTSIVFIVFIAFLPLYKKVETKDLPVLMMMTYASYVLLSITIHPWYVALLIPLCLFTSFRSPILWSGLILMTYINYSFDPYFESLWVVAIEYILLYSYLIVEIKRFGWPTTTFDKIR